MRRIAPSSQYWPVTPGYADPGACHSYPVALRPTWDAHPGRVIRHPGDIGEGDNGHRVWARAGSAVRLPGMERC